MGWLVGEAIEVSKNTWKYGSEEGFNLIRTPGYLHFKTPLSSETSSYPR